MSDAWPEGDPSLARLSAENRRFAVWFANGFWLLPAVFYALTGSRGLGWIDGAMIVNNVFLLKSGSWVNDHNLFLYLGRLWLLVAPVSPAHAMNLMAGAFGAVTVFVLFRTGLLLTRNLLACTAGAVALMLSHSLWWHSTTVEVYTLNTSLIALMLWFVARWSEGRALADLLCAGLCLGLGVSNHVLVGLYVASFAALFALPSLRAELWRPRVVGALAVAVALGAQLWFVKFEEDLSEKLDADGASWTAQTLPVEQAATTYTLWRATGGKFQDSMFPTESPARWKWWGNYAALLPYNYPSIALVAGLVGWVAFARDRRRRPVFAFFAAGFAVQALWSSNYFVWDMYAFGLPVWTTFSIPIMYGFDALFRMGGVGRRVALAGLPTLLVGPVLYATVPSWAKEPGFWQSYFSFFTERNLWDAAEFFANPDKHAYHRAEDVLAAYDRTLPEGAQLWDTDALGYWIFHGYFQRVLGGRPDVTSHLVFSAFQEPDKVVDGAAAMRRELEHGERVFLASVNRPIRGILVQLYADLSPGRPVKELAHLSTDELRATFPQYEIGQVRLDGVPDAWIYEIAPR